MVAEGVLEGVGDSESWGGNKACDPVRSQPQVPDVELRRMGEAMEEVIGGVWFPTTAFRASLIDGWIESILIAVQCFAKH